MISIEKVNKVYPNGFHAVKDVDLEIKTGDIFGIIGLSGAGKSFRFFFFFQEVHLLKEM